MPVLLFFLPGPVYIRKAPSRVTAFDRTVGFVFDKAAFVKSIRSRTWRPTIPKSSNAWCIQMRASVIIFGDFAFFQMGYPWDKTNCSDVLSAKATRHSAAGFLSLMSPSFSTNPTKQRTNHRHFEIILPFDLLTYLVYQYIHTI